MPNTITLLLIPITLWGVLLFGGYLTGKPGAARTRIPTTARLGSSVMLTAFAWMAFILLDLPLVVGLFMALGMSISLIGDVFMAKLLLSKRHPLPGMSAFALAHLCYISAFVVLGSTAPFLDRLTVWMGWLMAGLVGWTLLVYGRQRKHSLIHYAALPYALLLASTVGAAHGLALGNGDFVPLVVGAALFLLSDALIAAELFGGVRHPRLPDMIWLTYGPAQALIMITLFAMANPQCIVPGSLI